MVVSKDSKRKRKESPPPQPPIIESSPEMPKRTKVQAQRKFAQGQSAPTSSYAAAIAASSSSATGPSASSESREPPTEILPNKRPKTEDFLTFLCFRGTPALPAHLDFLNQGKGAQETENATKRKQNRGVATKINKKTPAKKGKKAKAKTNAKTKSEPIASTSAAAAALLGDDNKNGITKNDNKESIGEQSKNKIENDDEVQNDKVCNAPEDTVMPFAVRKRAEQVTEGNRRSRINDRQQKTTSETEKSNKTPETKRRSNRSSVKDLKRVEEPETEEDEEYFSAKDEEDGKVSKDEVNPKKSKTPTIVETKASTPSKDSDSGVVGKGKKGPGRSGTTRNVENIKDDASEKDQAQECTINRGEQVNKGKQTVKRSRQKESPIFIPSPEPTGRMTRQRAFFEPVKVPPRDLEDSKDNSSEKYSKEDVEVVEKSAKLKKVNAETGKKNASEEKKNDSNIKSEDKLNSSDKNVFDFSSDDEQPLAKTIKLKKNTSPKKNVQSSKRQTKKGSQKKSLGTTEDAVKKEETQKDENLLNEEHVASLQEPEQTDVKNRRGKLLKKKVNIDDLEESNVDDESSPPVPKKGSNMRQQRKKTKIDQPTSNGSARNDELEVPVRNQRPSRKTKEAAAIYMGIIGQKLQQNDDEDDDLSLNSFPDLPNVKEMEKMEIELKKNAAQTTTNSVKTTSPTFVKSPSKSTAAESDKQASVGRRGRPPKQGKPPPAAKREIEGMLVKKGALAKVITNAQNDQTLGKHSEDLKEESDDEDFLLNEEVNETKRKLEKSFSDSDDEPLAIKVNLKSSDKEADHDSKKLDSVQTNKISKLTMLPIGSTQVSPSPQAINSSLPANTSPITAANQNVSQSPSVFNKVADKKSPIPNSKILNVPATYTMPSTQNANASAVAHPTFNKTMEHKLISSNITSSYLPPASPHYHPSHARPASTHQPVPTAKSPTQPPPPTHIVAPPPPQSPLKYQTPPTTYPPPIEAYPSPKINPNFLTPKFDRSSLPRTNNFPSPSPVKFDISSSTAKTGIANSTFSPKTMPTLPVGSNTVLTTTPSTSTAVGAAAANASSDPLKDEIGSILAANLMPSKEESGKIFGIASVSLAQSSGPDNTKCTLGKCGSIHKPVLGPVVPTEGYIGDQLSSKERRKAKVNMTHEQIQKWLIECSSNPDEIQDDLDDDFDDNLRPNLYATTPPPTRDDKESTSFSSSSKATRDLGKSESAWSGKGPSLKAIPVVATASTKDEEKKEKTGDLDIQQLQSTIDNDTPLVNQVQKSNPKQNSTINDTKPLKEKLDKKVDKKTKEDKVSKDTSKEKETKQNKVDKEKDQSTVVSNSKSTAAGKQSNMAVQRSVESPTSSKPNRKKNSSAATTPTSKEDKSTTLKSNTPNTNVTSPGGKVQKRTPVYNQKSQKQPIELKETTTTSHKKKSPFSYTFEAFSVENEKSIYSFDKDDEEDDGTKPMSKPVFRRQSRRDSHPDDTVSTPNPTPRTSPSKQKRNAAGAAEKVNKDVANASQNSSVSLTLSPSENCKLVKVSLEAEKQSSAAKGKAGKVKSKLDSSSTAAAEAAAADSDSDGHTFYIPLQGAGAGGSAEGGIQGVAVKLGREGPEGPNQKVIMHATLVTKAQMGQNSKPLPDSMNASEIVKNLLISSANAVTGSTIIEASKNSTSPIPTPSTSAAAAVTTGAAVSSAPNSLKSVPIGTVQPRFKGTADPAATSTQPTTSTAASGSGLVRVNSNSSLFSGSAKSRHGPTGPSTAGASKKLKDDTPIKMSNNTAFPRHDDPTQMVEAPIFRPTEKEFADPIDFIERITPIAARFGICKIIPPATFKPECRISDEMRFTAYNQYVHKMLHRWGPSAKELSAIKKYLATQSITMNHPPWIGGMEVDLPRLYHTVQELGGLKEVIEKKKWARVAEEMCIPKLAQDRVTKLDDIYCKYLLPYDTLSPSERQKLFDEVEADWAKREARARRNADRFVNTESVSNEEDDVSSDDDEESEEEVDGVSMECIVKGRSMPLSQFYRIARNTMTLWFKNTEPTVNEVEAEFWRHVAVRDSHVCVHSGSIDSSGWGYGFPSPGPKGKGSNYARHPWNLKVLTNNPSSVLRSLGPVMGVTVPTLHVGMLFSACCWYRDPHGLSWIEYLHTGASKLWYGIPDDQSANFRSALTSLIPTHCQNKTIWLPCDTVMVPPHMLTDRGVSLCRIEQKPGEFIVVFPRAYTSSLATGYVVSESVYFATNSWLDLAKDDFRDIHDSCEPAMFSLEQLLFALGSDQRVSPDTLQQMLPMLNEVYEKETAAREQLKAAGVTSTEKVPNEKSTKSKKQHPVKSIESECDLCRANLYISMVKTDEGNVYCLQHALKNLNNGNIQAKQCKLIFAYNVEDIENLIKTLNDKIQQKRTTVSNKKSK